MHQWIPELLDGAQSDFPRPIDDRAWLVQMDGFDPLREREVESCFTVSNGRTGTRGSLEEGLVDAAPAAYVAGLFGRAEGGDDPPQLISGPEWTRLLLRIGRETLRIDRGEILELRRILDLRQGILFRFWRHRLPSGTEIAFRSARFASLADRNVLVLQAEVEPGRLVRLTGRIPLPTADTSVARSQTRKRDGRVAIEVQGAGNGRAHFAISTSAKAAAVHRLVAVARAAGDGSAGPESEEALARAGAAGIPELQARHCSAWRDRWRDADVVIGGDLDMQRAMRFALYHLISAGDPESDVASIGARGLTGPGYRGHVFWDTDVFMVPFFVYTHPPTARALLAYRYRTLPAARDKASALGLSGALYAWESADTGQEVTPFSAVLPDGSRMPILTGMQEHHISADVAWAVWQYWRATGDDGFLLEMGAEIVLETARFWSSRSREDPDGRYHIDSVIGPDEYHESVRDNAFTNALARWNLERGLELVNVLTAMNGDAWARLSARLDLGAAELEQWRVVAEGLVDGFDQNSLLYEQFSGFFELEDLKAAALAPRPYAGELVLGLARLRRSQIVKQPDVLMLAHMLPELVSTEVAAANYRYYEPRTSHGSSLSPAIHCAVAARVGALDEARDYFRMAAMIDLESPMWSASQGLHLATMGGLWQAAVMGFGGLRATEEGLRLDPRVPPSWERLAFPVRWRGARLEVEADPDTANVRLEGRARVGIGESTPRSLGPGRYISRRDTDGWSPLQEVGGL